MVLDAGHIVSILWFKGLSSLYPLQVEFDSPKELLKRTGGKLRSLVDESGDRDLLYAMAQG